MTEKKFIIWDPKDGPVAWSQTEPREIISSGSMGTVTTDNVYLCAYAGYPEGSKKLDDLEVNECVRDVKFQLSGERGTYDIYRVR